ncbi:amidohydrolase family protein [Sphingomonas humi]|uniref:Amidohydrolase family protein n=1 Tax=Sphingomonas humi TaxID=335630 RepID=A0ABP7RQM2_9SPHN
MLSMLVAAAIAQAATAQPVTVIYAGTLIDVPGRAPMRNASVVIQGRKIVEIRDGFATIPGARIVDLRSSTVMPGLIDSHVHLGGLDDRLQARLQAPVRNDEDEAFTALANAKKTLAAGFTTVRDLGGDPPTIRALKGAINSGAYVGPSILMAAKMISVSGGHGDPVNGLNRELAEIGHNHESNVCNGADDCRRATREQIRDGADVVKFAATGGVLSNVAGGLNQQMMEDEMRAIVETARSFGRKVAVHAHGTSGINAALRSGANSIEHGTFADDETFRLYKQTGAYYVPTLMAPAAAYKDGERGALTPAQFEKAAAAKGNAEKSFARAVREGVKIAFGTDSAVSPHGKNAEEFGLMVKNGMAPADAIKAATVNAADLLGVSAVAGTIEAGKDADIIAVDGDPLANIRLMENVGFVMKWGQVYKLGGQRQLTAAD